MGGGLVKGEAARCAGWSLLAEAHHFARSAPRREGYGQVSQRFAECGEFPIENGADVTRRGHDGIVEPEIAVNERGAFRW